MYESFKVLADLWSRIVTKLVTLTNNARYDTWSSVPSAAINGANAPGPYNSGIVGTWYFAHDTKIEEAILLNTAAELDSAVVATTITFYTATDLTKITDATDTASTLATISITNATPAEHIAQNEARKLFNFWGVNPVTVPAGSIVKAVMRNGEGAGQNFAAGAMRLALVCRPIPGDITLPYYPMTENNNPKAISV